MGQVRKVGDVYYIEFYARGLMYSQIAGPDLAAAEKLLEQTEAKIAGGEALTVERHIDIPVFFQQFMAYAGKEWGARTAKRFEDLIAHFSAFLGKQPGVRKLAHITPSVIEAYKASRSPSTKPHLVNFSILLLREVMEYGIKLGFINDNPTLHVRLLPVCHRRHPSTKRHQKAKELLANNVTIAKAAKLMGIKDIARIMYYADLVPVLRPEMYG